MNKVLLLEMPVANRNPRAAAAHTAVTSTGPKGDSLKW